MSHLWTDITSIVFAITGVLLIFIILLQRGRGGGLAGAFGATGGQSAFGTKAGDVFTRITIGVAVFWVAMAGLTSWAMVSERSKARFQSEAPARAPALTRVHQPPRRNRPARSRRQIRHRRVRQNKRPLAQSLAGRPSVLAERAMGAAGELPHAGSAPIGFAAERRLLCC
jgi:protein translocase SecG subunit